MLNLKDKVVLITGASSGIGAACAVEFAKLGAHLIICARRKERLTKLADKLNKDYGTKIFPLTLDIGKRKAVEDAVANLPKEWQEIDVLVNNAGLSAGFAFMHEADLDDWDEMVDCNIKGVLYLTRAILPQMVKRKDGHIINIGSIVGHEVYPKAGVYCATKHAVTAITKGLKMDLSGTDVRVSSVDPGLVKTEFGHVRFKGDTTKVEEFYRGVVALTAEDVADAVIYCATRPKHVNISEIIILPTDQASTMVIHRR